MLQVVQIRPLVCAVKKGTLEELVMELQIRLLVEETDDGSQVLDALKVLMVRILVRILVFTLCFVCWKPIIC